MDKFIDSSGVIEVELIDAAGNSNIYWVKKLLLNGSDDEIDLPIELALAFHKKRTGTSIPEDDFFDGYEYQSRTSAYEPFSRLADEFTWVE
jgi:hypothetical protein